MKSGKSKSFPFTNLLNLYVTEKEDVGNDGEVKLYIFPKIEKWH